MSLPIHLSIKEKLKIFKQHNKVPNIIFNGPSGSGKSVIVNEFVSTLYNNDKDLIKNFVMFANCAHGKGIKFIRDEIKFFAKTHIISHGGLFKSVVLFNGDKLTIDAQSALRRCIELFSTNTRFFIVVEDKYKILKPILSRFCEMYIPEPILNGKRVNLCKHNLELTYNSSYYKLNHVKWLKTQIDTNVNNNTTVNALFKLVSKFYEKGYSALDVIFLLENDMLNNLNNPIDEDKKYELLTAFAKIKKDFRCEKMLMVFLLNFLFIDKELDLNNISLI